MFLEFIDQKTIYLIAHIFGVALGAGGAFASDTMFFSTIKDGRIQKHELRFMKLGGRLVWLGLAVLFVSGILLVLTDPTGYLSSSKFLAKISIVGVIVLNGIIFHFIHIPHIHNHLGLKFADSPTFVKRAPLLMASGAISVTSWISTVILGMLKNIPYGYEQIMGLYLALLGTAVLVAVLMTKPILHLKT